MELSREASSVFVDSKKKLAHPESGKVTAPRVVPFDAPFGQSFSSEPYPGAVDDSLFEEERVLIRRIRPSIAPDVMVDYGFSIW